MQSNKYKPLLVTAVLVAAAGLLISGCSASGKPDSKTLTVQVLNGAQKEFGKWINLFKEKNPGVTVKTVTLATTAKDGSNLQVLTSNNAPDVAMLPLESSVYAQMTAGKQLLSLADVYKSEDLKNRYGASTTAAAQYEGVPYVVPYDNTLYNVVWYNKKMFAKIGIPDPTDHRIQSLDQLKDIVAKLKAAGTQGLAVGAASNFQSSWMIDALLPTTATPSQFRNYLTNWQPGTKLTARYTDSAFVKTLEQILSMSKSGVFQDGYLGATVPQAIALWEQGKTGMLLGGDYDAAQFKTDKISFDYGWALLPPVNSSKKSQLTSYVGDTLGIPIKAKNPEMAKKFLETVMSSRGQAVVPTIGGLPAVHDVPASAYKSAPVAVQEQIADVANNGSAAGWSAVVPSSVGELFIEPIEQQMLNGKGTPKSVAAQTEAALQAVRSKQ